MLFFIISLDWTIVFWVLRVSTAKFKLFIMFCSSVVLFLPNDCTTAIPCSFNFLFLASIISLSVLNSFIPNSLAALIVILDLLSTSRILFLASLNISPLTPRAVNATISWPQLCISIKCSRPLSYSSSVELPNQ